jgi:electron transport complex protein RnfG
MKPAAREAAQIVGSMTVVCLAGATILGIVHAATERRREEVLLAEERRAAVEMLDLDAAASVLEVRQSLDPDSRTVVYRARPFGESAAPGHELRFALDGSLISRAELPAGASEPGRPLGRILVAEDRGRPAGFLVEGEARGFKNRIRFFVALSESLSVLGVRVLEHEEDPGLGAEIATAWFQEQFAGRTAGETSALTVTRDPMPEDWRAALVAAALRQPGAAERHARLLARERTRPIYAVTGATISSRAITEGVRAATEHFRRRWALLAPHLGGPA